MYLQYEYRRLLFDTALVCFGLQYIRTYTNGGSDSHADTTSSEGGDDVDLAAVKASMDYAGLDLQLSYSKNRGQSGISNGYGGLSKVYTSSMIANGRKNNRPGTWSLKTAYEVLLSPRLGTTELALWLTKTRYEDLSDSDFFSTYAHLRHQFGVNTSAYLRFERIDYAEREKTSYIRLILKQKF